MQQETITLIVAGLGIVGTLTSGPLTQFIAKRSQREQWERDKKTEEFRELLDALTVAYLERCEIARNAVIMTNPFESDQTDGEVEPTAAEMTAYRLLRTRLFTAIDLEAEDVTKRWTTAFMKFRSDGGIEEFATRFSNISATIVWLSTGKGKRPQHV
jgi:hypothetical protein